MSSAEALSPTRPLDGDGTEKLRKRTKARNRRILASSTDRLNRIVGLSTNNSLDTAPSPPPTINTTSTTPTATTSANSSSTALVTEPATIATPPPEVQPPSIEDTTTAAPTYTSTPEKEKASSSQEVTVNHPSPTSVPLPQTPSPSPTPLPHSRPRPQPTPVAVERPASPATEFKRNLPLLDESSGSGADNPLALAFMKVLQADIPSSPSASSARGGNELVPASAEFDGIQDLITSMLPPHLAKSASDALSSLPSGPEPLPASSPRSLPATWILDSQLGSVARATLLTLLVCTMLYLTLNSTPTGNQLEAQNYPRSTLQHNTALASIPLFGSLQPFHVLMALEICLQTHRYFNTRASSRAFPSSSLTGTSNQLNHLYQLFQYYSASWSSLVDDLCLVVFVLGLGLLVRRLWLGVV